MTDEQILDEFERRAMKLRDFMGYPTVDGVRVIEGVRALLATPAPLSDEPVANLHGEIMNIRCETPKALSINERLAYQQGHRDARHAAADLANAAPLAQSAEQDRIDCGECACLPGICDKEQALDLQSLLDDVTAIDTWHRGSPSYEHDAGWFKDRVVRLIEERIKGASK